MESGRSALIHYNHYGFTYGELLLYGLMGLAAAGVMGYIFYRSVLGAVLLSLWIPFYLKRKGKELCEVRKRELNLQFKESILAVSSNLQAGYSVENAFRQAYFDMELIYGGESLIGKELFYLSAGLDNNVTIEALLTDFAHRSGIDNIADFAEIFKIAKRNGGDMNAVIHASVDTICGRIEVMKEIQTMLYAKQFEQKIMNVVPLLIIIYIQSTSKGFFDPLYHNLTGIIIMTACLAIYGGAILLAGKITEITV